MYISEIWIHPVKALRGIKLDQCRVNAYGFEHDREYMLAVPDPKTPGQYKFLTQRECPLLALVDTELQDDRTLVLRQGQHTLEVPLDIGKAELDSLPAVATDIWGVAPTSTDITSLVPGFTDFFSRLLRDGATDAVLVAPRTRRAVTASMPPLDGPPPESNFQDYFPGNMINERSLDNLKLRLQDKGLHINLDAANFRPNVVVHGADAWDEDNWKQIQIGEFPWLVPCRNIRCRVPTIDIATGTFNPNYEPYKTLQSFRRVDKGKPYLPCFGMNMVNEFANIVVKVGDPVTVLSRGEHCYEDISIVQ